MGKIKKRFLEKQKGTIAVEWVLTAPCSMLILFSSIMFFLFCTNYFVVSNAAFEISQALNMGDTGYKKAASMSAGAPGGFIQNTKLAESNSKNFNNLTSGYLREKAVKSKIDFTCTSSEGGVFAGAARKYTAESYQTGRLTLPYTQIKSIDCRVYGQGAAERTGFNTKKGETESGDMVVVTIKYTFFNWFDIETRGYSFII